MRHKKAYKGAWVSNQREKGYGDHVLVFNQCITQINTKVFIGFEKGKVNWRGLQKAIPFIGQQEGEQNQSIRYLALWVCPKMPKKGIINEESFKFYSKKEFYNLKYLTTNK